MRNRTAFLPFGLALLICSQPAFGWWDQGHRIIASIAQSRLNPKAAAAVKAILPEGMDLAAVAAWADVVRKERKETGPWHYIDIPTSAQPGDWEQYCPAEGCVVRAVEQMRVTLADASAPREKRDEALRFLVHFVGDMHQPLHAGERGDKGGNAVQTVFAGQPINLHAAWDGKLLQAWFQAEPDAEQKLLAGAPEADRAAISAGTPGEWIWQSVAASRDAVYGPLDRCNCNTLDDAYLAQAKPVLQAQIVNAGERLGRMLNETLGQ